MLSHFHADHVDGLEGVLSDVRVGALETTRVLDPAASVEEVSATARAAGLAPVVASHGAARRYGDLTLQVLAPSTGPVVAGSGDGSSANDASVVLLAEVRGVRILLTGDLEPPGQAALARSFPGLGVDVLKVPHHGSRHQATAWLTSLGARVGLVSVGEDNGYGHPSPDVLDPLADAGVEVHRTDLEGTVAVVVSPDGDLEVRTHG